MMRPTQPAPALSLVSATALLATSTLAHSAAAPAPAGATAVGTGKKLTSIAVYPPAISLETAEDFHQVVVTATFEDGTTSDVTAKAAFKAGNPNVAPFKDFTFRPGTDGSTTVDVTYGGQAAKLPLKVVGATTPRPTSFRLDVMPVFLKQECNNGSCHGAARGQDRFMLSLFGYDPAGDHHRLTRELSGRRLNLAIPEESLLVEKAIEAVPHSGGKLFEKDSAPYKTLVNWIERGAKDDDPKEIAKVVGIEIFPPELVLEGSGATQQMSVVARYSDGTDRDVTTLSVFSTNNDLAAAVDASGLVTSGVRGEAFVMARYDAFTQGSQAIVIPEKLQYARPELPANNYIDSLVYEKLHKLRILPSGQAEDEAFLRRATLDITGKLPTKEEYAAFLADRSPDRRARLVDSLIARDEFTDLWVMKFAELLQVRTSRRPQDKLSYKAIVAYHGWLKEQFSQNVPIDRVVHSLLTSTGGTIENPPANFYQVERSATKLAENVAQVFMGMRLQCAQCHNHPFDRWTMEDYYGWSAFFSQVGRKDAEDPREVIVYDRKSGEVNHPVTKKPEPAKFLGGDVAEVKGKDRRAVVADWLTSPDNPYFATNLANIIWSHFFGVGIIEPVDDVRISNPPSNPQLLEALGKEFAASGFDFRKLVRDICNSKVYQLDTRPNDSNELDHRNFARATIRRQRAEVLLDTISQATATENKFKGLRSGARAVEIADGNTGNYFLTTFGRASRGTVCSCEVKMDPNLGQALHLINGDTVHNNITRGGVVKSLVDGGTPPAEVIDSLYVRCYSRKATAPERDRLLAKLGEPKDKAETQAFFEDVFWALLNSKEFLFNH